MSSFTDTCEAAVNAGRSEAAVTFKDEISSVLFLHTCAVSSSPCLQLELH